MAIKVTNVICLDDHDLTEDNDVYVMGEWNNWYSAINRSISSVCSILLIDIIIVI